MISDESSNIKLALHKSFLFVRDEERGDGFGILSKSCWLLDSKIKSVFFIYK